MNRLLTDPGYITAAIGQYQEVHKGTRESAFGREPITDPPAHAFPLWVCGGGLLYSNQFDDCHFVHGLRSRLMWPLGLHIALWRLASMPRLRSAAWPAPTFARSPSAYVQLRQRHSKNDLDDAG